MTQQSDPRSRKKKSRRKRDRPAWRQKLELYGIAWAATLFIWLLRLTCRIRVVEGQQHLDAAIARGTAIVPCAWHRRLVPSCLFLRSLVRRKMIIGFLISPSREGEIMSRLAHAHGVTPIRGSSSRTGSEALESLATAVNQGISPMMYGDGPRGPVGVFKPGAVVLASRTGAPLFLIGAAVNRFWQLKSWDTHRIPKPFSCFKIAIGEPMHVGTLEDNQQAEDMADEISRRLHLLDGVAEAAQPRKPAVKP